jgi:hypothetical protein
MSEEVIHECRPTGNPEKKSPGIGMPASLYLHEFGRVVSEAFDGETAYQVGSSIDGKTWRDVDVRIMLDDEVYAAMKLGDPERPQENAKWVALCMAFSELGRRMTGLPIDFQLQQTTYANSKFSRKNGDPRSALIMADVRRLQQQVEQDKQYPPPCSDCGEDSFVSKDGEKLYLTNPKGKCVGPFCNKCADEVRKKWHP